MNGPLLGEARVICILLKRFTSTTISYLSLFSYLFHLDTALGGEERKLSCHRLVSVSCYRIILSEALVSHKTIIFTDYFSDSSASKAAFASLAAFFTCFFQGHPHESHHRLPLHRGHEVPLLDHLRPRHACQVQEIAIL